MKSHTFDPLSFIAGLFFTGMGLAAASGGFDNLESLRLAWPIVLIALGGLLVVSTLAGSRSKQATDPLSEPNPATLDDLGADSATFEPEVAEIEPTESE